MKRYLKVFAYVVLIALALACSNKGNQSSSVIPTKPNIVVIYLDDLGYGDVGAYGATALKTPNMDKLAFGGLRFTNGRASSATCTPSRYALITGAYPWKNKNAHILPGDAPLIIDPSQMTLPKMLQGQGYYTGIVGKWHLGLGNGNVNWNEEIKPSPNEVGFDYSYILAATQDRVPTVYINDGKVVGLDPNDPIEVNYKKNFEGEPTGKDNPELLTMNWEHGHNASIVNGIPRIGYMKGGESAKWSDVDMADHFLEKAQEYVKDHKEQPFFLYYALQQPHVPRTPHPRFVGSSGMGPRGDVIVEADWCIGEFMKTLEEEGVLENTLIIFSSDNGPVLNDGYYDNAVEMLGEHRPSGPLRGGKYSLFEAGTRVPFITYWKGEIKPGVSNALVCQMDLLSSLAKLTGSEIRTSDSAEILGTLMGHEDAGREYLILEAGGRKAIVKKDEWVMIPPHKGQAVYSNTNIESGNSEEIQLYNLKSDLSQEHNLANENAEVLKGMSNVYEGIVGTKPAMASSD